MSGTFPQAEHVRWSNIIQELGISMSLIETGLTILQRSRMYNTQHFAFLLLLTSGFERLMKIILILHTFHLEGRFLSEREHRNLGHDLSELRRQIVDKCFIEDYAKLPMLRVDRDFIEHDPRLNEILGLMSDFAMTDRYTYLNGTARPRILTGGPDRRWGDLEMGQLPIEELTILWNANQVDVTKRRAVMPLVECIERFARALTRLFVFGALGDKGKMLTGEVRLFARLDDKDLGQRVYEL